MQTSKKSHAELSREFNKDESRVNWHDETLWWVRQKRDKAARNIPEWEQLRTTASGIKDNVLGNLHNYLIQFERKAIDNGIKVHWAIDAEEHNKIVHSILKGQGIRQVVKSKSMLTEECHLNSYLETRGIEVVDTDLGEYIVQLAKEVPSHIVLPCIHWKKEEISKLFHKYLATEPGNNDPSMLVKAARVHLRNKFFTRRAAITGVNFAIAETGEFVVCTNEGNADLGANLADVHIACMGIEKIIPDRKDLSVFLRLLSRSATGQPVTTYSSHYRKPGANKEIHIIVVDNGRSRQLGRPAFRNSLKCIRCGACFNTCPVYRRSGGHSYHSSIAGPIGSILAPNLDMKQYADLPFASTLCGSCTNVCPVKIDIHQQLYKWRQVLGENGRLSVFKKWSMKLMAFVMARPFVYQLSGRAARWAMRKLPWIMNNRFNPWYRQREMPGVPGSSFNEWYKKNRKGNEKQESDIDSGKK